MERAEALFSQVDRNNDGDITEEEWVAACLQDQVVPQIDPSVPQPVIQSRRRPLLGLFLGACFA